MLSHRARKQYVVMQRRPHAVKLDSFRFSQHARPVRPAGKLARTAPRPPPDPWRSRPTDRSPPGVPVAARNSFASYINDHAEVVGRAAGTSLTGDELQLPFF